MAREFTRVQFLHTFRAITKQPVKLRTLRAWECKENAVPLWALDGYRAVLNLSDAEVAALVAWAGKPKSAGEGS
jgi:hypothetical protein